MRLRPYPKYKYSDLAWVESIPVHWSVERLKHVSSVSFSNVDKHSKEGEIPIYLCNYVDVYYNDFITAEMDLMSATATTREIQRFGLKKGDVIITKDSETWDDIAVPAYVMSNFENVVCGYHLALIRSNKTLVDARYLFHAFSTFGIDDQFKMAATGVTRYGLGKYALDNSLFLIPPLPEQQAIADFLDRETAILDTLIAKQRELIERLREKRTALISHAVTRGLDPNIPLKDSGVEWLGEIPAHWEVRRTKMINEDWGDVVQTGPFGAQLHASDYVNEGIPLILIRNVNNLYIDDTDIPKVTEEMARSLSMYRLKIGDIVFSRVGSIGRIALVTDREEGWLISGQMLRLRLNSALLMSCFAIYAYSSYAVLQFIELKSVGSTRESINTDILRNMPIPLPPIDEQVAIADFIDKESTQIDELITKVETVITCLQEYRTALISAAVTGKIDVRPPQ